MRFGLGDIKRLAAFISAALVLIIVFVALTARLYGGHALASAGINQQLSFTGKIVKSDGTNIADGTYNMEFKIYQDGNDQGTGSTLKWTEDWRVGHTEGGIALTSGTFQVNLGAGADSAALDSAVNWNQSVLWLSIQIGNSTTCTISTSFQVDCGGDTEMKPYISLTAVPQAFNAENLGGLSYSSYVQLSPGSPQSGNLNVTGGLTIGSGQSVTVGASAGQTGSASCGAGQAVTGIASTGGIVTTAPTCGSVTASSTLHAAYASGSATGDNIINLTTGTGKGGVFIQDSSGGLGSNLFAVQSNTGTATYFAVTAASSGSIVVGSATNAVTIASGSITTSSGNMQVSAAGTTTIGNGTGAINITAGTGAAVNITALANSTWQVQGTTLTLDAQSASASTLSVVNSGAGSITLGLESGGVYAVGASTGQSVTCSSGQAPTGPVFTGGIITTAGTCAGVIQNQSGVQSSSQFHISGTGVSDTSLSAPQLISTVATGTSPLTITSTTVVGNLNVSQLQGSTWASPPAIGSGTPAAGTFTTLQVNTANGLTLGVASSANGGLVLKNSSNANTITIQSGATAGSITVILPATTPGGSTQQGDTNLPFVINLTADSAASSSTTLADITASGVATDALSLTIPAGQIVKFNAQILYVSSSTSNAAIIGWKCSNASQSSTAAGILPTTAAAVVNGGTVTACTTTAANIVAGSTAGVTTPQMVVITGTVKANAGGATTLTLEYARSGTTGNTTIKAGSNITWWQ